MLIAVFEPDRWSEFFLMVGGGTAALTGLVFVALSLNAERVTRDPTHNNRAVGTLTGFVAVFVTCSLVLMGGQGHVAVGIEWTCVAATAAAVHIRGFIRAATPQVEGRAVPLYRLIFGTGCYLAEVIGAILIIFGVRFGPYLAATAMTILIAYMISGAWLLIVGVGSGTGNTAR